MAEPQTHERRRGSGLDSAFTPQNQTNPSKFYSYFLSKPILIAIFIALLSLFPYKAPEFINQTIITRSWEILHLLFVGIAISYGLFSRRNHEIEKEDQSKFESTETYVSKILNFSPVFDDEVQSPSGSDENKIQTWNSQYFRREPSIVVKPKTSGFDHNCEKKSLSLPVRSLKSGNSDPEVLDFDDEISGFSGSDNESGSVSMGSWTRNGKIRDGIGEIGDVDALNFKQKLDENALYRSPIRVRSQSARMERNISPTFSPEKNISRSFKDEYMHSSSSGDWMSEEDLGISFLMSKSKNHVEASVTGKSVKAVRASESKRGEISGDEMEEKTEKGSKEVEPVMWGKLETKTGSDQSSIGSPETITESEDSERGDTCEISDIEDAALNSAVGSEPNANEVDKKADEFIAKFKEQMRLQRTASVDKTVSGAIKIQK